MRSRMLASVATAAWSCSLGVAMPLGCGPVESAVSSDASPIPGNLADGSSAEAGSADAANEASPDSVNGCPEKPAPRRTTGTVLQLLAEPYWMGAPFAFGQPNTADSLVVTPLDLRFYVSEVALMSSTGAAVPVDLMTDGNVVEPYGVHLVTADVPSSLSMRVLAPPGTYTGIKFTFGVNDACNAGPTDRNPPFSAASQMTWPHLAGYLFFRYEGSVASVPGSGGLDAGDGGVDGALTPDQLPTSIHMGGQIGTLFAPSVEAVGPISLSGAGPVVKRLRFAMDEVFKGATANIDITGFVGFPSPEVFAGERLRRSLPSLTLFGLIP